MRSLERGARRAFLGLLARAFGASRRHVALPDWHARPYRVLFIRNDGVGDLIVSTPTLRAIAGAAPGITVDVLASPQNAPLARRLPYVHDVLEHSRGFLLSSWPVWRALRRRRYDVVVDARVVSPGVSTQTTALLLSTRAPWRIGIGGRRDDRVYSVPVQPQSWERHVEAIAALAGPFGVDGATLDLHPEFPLDPDERTAAEQRWGAWGTGGMRVLVNITAGHANRRWPDDRYAAVLRHLRERLPDATIAVLAMEPDFQSARTLAAAVDGVPVQLPLMDTAATVATAGLVITPDTAVSHMASAFRRPVLNLMRRGFERWAPYGVPGRNVFGPDDRVLSGLDAEPVLRALDELLAELFPG